MALASILVAIAAFACTAIGFVTTLVPGVGAVFSFLAPTLAIAACVLGGVAMSRAKRLGEKTDLARAGVILSVVAFVPGLLVAVFCGTCNALYSSGQVQMQKNVRFGTTGPQLLPMAGNLAPPPFPDATGAGGGPAQIPPKTAVQGPTGGPGAAQPQPDLPPPPLPAGPTRHPAPPQGP